MSQEIQQLLTLSENKIYQLAGEKFNVNSPKQLQTILFDKLGLPKGKKTKDGYSTDVDVLSWLAASHELPAEILAYRSFAKLKSTYIDALPLMVNPETGRVHTSYNQTVTATGRLSSSNPNLQNIPIRTLEGKTDPSGLHRPRGLGNHHCRLLPDRAPGPGPSVAGSGAHRGFRLRGGHPQPARLRIFSAFFLPWSMRKCGARPRSSTSASSTA